MALFEHDIETGRRGLTGSGARTLNAALPTSLLGGKFRSAESRDKDAFSGKVLKGLMTGNTGLFKTNEKMVKNTTMMTGFAKADLRLQASTNQFTQRGFKLNKDNITRTAKFYKADETIRKEEKRYYKTELKNRKEDTKRQRRLDAEEKRWRANMLKATTANTENTETMQRMARIGAGAKGVGALSKVVGAPLALMGLLMRRSSKFLNQNSRNLGILNASVRQLAVTLGRTGADLSYEQRYGAGSTDAAQASRLRARQEADARQELRARGFSDDQVRTLQSETGMSRHDLAQDRGLDNRTRSQRIRDRFNPANTFNQRGAVAGGARFAGRMGSRGMGIARGVAGAAGMVGRAGAKFLPGIGLAVEGARAIQSAKRGDYFSAAIAGAGGIASVIPGLGPIVSIALESLAMMVPDGIKDAFNKWAGPYFEKMIGKTAGSDGPAGIVGKIMSKFGDAMESVWRILKGTILHPKMLQVYAALGMGLLRWGSFLASGISGLFGFIADLVEGKKGLWGAFVDNLTPVLKSAADNIVPMFTNLFTSLFDLVWSTIKGAAANFFTFGRAGDPSAPTKTPGTGGTTTPSTSKLPLPSAAGGAGLSLGAKWGNQLRNWWQGGPQGPQTPQQASAAMSQNKTKIRTKLQAIEPLYAERDQLEARIAGLPPGSILRKSLGRKLRDKLALIEKREAAISAISPEALSALKSGKDPMAAFDKRLSAAKSRAAGPQPSSAPGQLPSTPVTHQHMAFKDIAAASVSMESLGKIDAVNTGGYLKGAQAVGFLGAFGKYQFAERTNENVHGGIDTASAYIKWLQKHPNREYKMIGDALGRHPISSAADSPFRKSWEAFARGPMGAAFETSQDIYAKKQYWSHVRGKVLGMTGVSIDTLAPAVQSAIFATSIGAGSGATSKVLEGFGPGLASASPTDVINALVNMRDERSPTKEKANLQAKAKMWRQWAKSGVAPASFKGIPSPGSEKSNILTSVAGLYQTVMGKASAAGGGVGGVGAVMGSIGNAIITKGAAALASGKNAVEALGLPPNLMGGSAGAIARAVTGAVGAAAGEMGRMQDAMGMVFAGDPNLQKLGQNIGQITGHTGAMANAQNPEKVQIDPKDNGLINLLSNLGGKAI